MPMYDFLDDKLRRFSTKLRDDLRIEAPASLRLATSLRDEIRTLESLPKFADHPLNLHERLDWLHMYFNWQNGVADCPNNFGSILSMNYVAFVYLGDTCFKFLRKELPRDCMARRCSAFLTDNPVRMFRNALAHGNWRFSPDRSGIDFWARKGDSRDEPMEQSKVLTNDLEFWQFLAIATAYAVMMPLADERHTVRG